MNKANLKSYAPKARLDFIKAVTERANVLGISAAGVVPAEVRGDVALIDGREWPAKVAGQRDELIARIKRHGFEQTMDEVAYTWFNRFAALRYMEIHDYLGHGWRVLSSRDGGLPEILRHASEVTLPGLNPDRAREMQLAGNQDNGLYKLLLVAQCNELSRVMPFLFERIDDETELLLPENLLRTDSIVAKLVEQVPEEDWREIEVIGWLYQFYISEKKDQVIGKVVKSEDIPAATQLFTPNWIVQYLVQNSVGRLWLLANPTSTLASQWQYYIQPAEQTPEVQAQLDALIQTRIREDGETLNPETITVLDPACGSGHILVVAYDVLKAIYLERGYQPRAIPRLILEKNLYGLDIDVRAAQLAAFALLMKARADDRRLFDDPPHLNVLNLTDSKDIDVIEVARSLSPFNVSRNSIALLASLFKDSKNFGSLIRVPADIGADLEELDDALKAALYKGDLYAQQAAKQVLPLAVQARLLCGKFDSVVANPPYMGSQYYNNALRKFTEDAYSLAKADLYACFILRNLDFTKPSGVSGMITIPNWMFLSSFEQTRGDLLSRGTLDSLSHNGRGVFGSDFGSVAFTFRGATVLDFKGCYRRLFEQQGSVASVEELREKFLKSKSFCVASSDLLKIPGSPIAYWIGHAAVNAFAGTKLFDIGRTRRGLQTGSKDRFIRYWYECDLATVEWSETDQERIRASSSKWFKFNNGGDFRRWYGNLDLVVNWRSNGQDIKQSGKAIIPSEDLYFSQAICWPRLTVGKIGFRIHPKGVLPGDLSPCLYAEDHQYLLAYLNSSSADYFLSIINPTVTTPVGDVAKLPIPDVSCGDKERLRRLSQDLIGIFREDWNSVETSWDFVRSPLIVAAESRALMSESWAAYQSRCGERLNLAAELERENNGFFIAALDLAEELDPDVPADSINLNRADRQIDSQRLLSYIIGCALGRYSLVEDGVVYARAGNVAFDPARYAENFSADIDGILPLTDVRWFDDDATDRVRDFVRVVWGTGTLEGNISWLAESLGAKAGEIPDQTLRRYLTEKFFKEHLQTYKKRPIYWLFSSGKQGAFQALVYLHRYNEGTLARMRAEYVVPLIAKMVSRLDMLDKDLNAASSAAARTKLQKQVEALRKKQIELLAYDEKLRHYADMRITLDLDDGVKVNYAKFGDLVAESKAITGGSDDT